MTLFDSNESTLHLLGGPFFVAAGHRFPVPEGSKRLVAFIALNGRRVDRQLAAAAIWPDVDQCRAAGNLRSAVWRLRCSGIDVLDADIRSLAFRVGLQIDLDAVASWAHRIVTGTPELTDLDFLPIALQALELLPGWYDEWLLIERDRLRQQTLDAIDSLARRLLALDRCGEAVDAALAAVCAEPLRESGQCALIQAHLAEGNKCEAWRSYATYESLLDRELGVEPPMAVTRLITLAAPRRPASPRSFEGLQQCLTGS